MIDASKLTQYDNACSVEPFPILSYNIMHSFSLFPSLNLFPLLI